MLFRSLDDIARLPGCGEVTADLLDAVLEEAGKFATGVLDPLNRTGDEVGCALVDGVVTSVPGFKQAFRQFSEGGWVGLANDPQWGGQGLPHIVSGLTSEMWNSANMAFALCPMLTAGAVLALARHGTPEQQTTYLPNLVSGKWTGTMNLTEPQAGSDLSAVRSKATPQGDHYLVQGTKIFITWGEHDMAENVVHMVLARTPDAPEGVKGISLFIVPKFLVGNDGSLGKRNDLKCVSIEHKLGIHGSPTCVMSYGDQGGAVAYLVGQENRGLEYMFTMMNFARLEVGNEGVAIAERAYQHALAYAKERVQGKDAATKSGARVAIIQHPDVRRMLMSMKSQVEAMRALSSLASASLDRALLHTDQTERAKFQSQFDLLTPVVKGWCTEQCIEVASTGVQIHGGMGYIEEAGAAQYLRDARITTIYEGTTGIQANDLAGRKLAYEKGVTAKRFIEEMRGLDEQLARATHPALRSICRELNNGIAALTEATDWLLTAFQSDPRTAMAGAVPYLKLFGTVTGGWLLARSALVAKARLDEGSKEYDFYRGKIASARFFAEHQLPLAHALKSEIVCGADSTLALEAHQF